MIEAVIFDCYGVLTTGGLQHFRHRHFGHDSTLAQQARDLCDRAYAGEVDYQDFIERMAAKAGVGADEARHEIERGRPNEELLEYIKGTLRPRYKLGILSNAAINLLPEIFQPWQLALFDTVILSCEVDAVKPDPKMYELAAIRLGLVPSACIFIDDQERYCDGAGAVGMQSVRYQSLQQLKGYLDAVLLTNKA